MTTVFLTGSSDPTVVASCDSDEVLFMEFSSKDIRGLKLCAICELHKIATSRNFSLCIAHRFKPIYIALIGTRLPVIGVHHAFSDYQRCSRKLLAWIFRKRLSLLGVSNAVRDDMRRSLPALPAVRIQTLYNRIDIEAMQALQVSAHEARDVLGLSLDEWVIGNVGRLHPDKDQATLLKGFALALPHLPARSRLAILGTGYLEQDLKSLACKLGIAERVLFFGYVPDARRYFHAFDTFVLSSNNEPFGMVLLEAMVAGVPLLATSCGGSREVVDGVGTLFPLGDAEHLGNGLLHLAAMNRQEHKQYSDMILKSLRQRFSDQVARDTFWQLPHVTELITRV
ncbi:Putative glycosyltransferase EpsD [Candidatus Pseudomonas adelgestsugas]|uniref:Glycosyltransferase EpsD n=1 Tax=Candidatus Pseudomonas adelgestsugas TaxID=1302376 RepID=A0ABX5R7E1_9PSED|nr:Putative glycosyltransferase EpsD [Candidatus Pseudomonas adelgestsugas]